MIITEEQAEVDKAAGGPLPVWRSKHFMAVLWVTLQPPACL